MDRRPKASLILNGAAGSVIDDEDLRTLEQRFKAHGYEIEILRARDGSELETYAREVAEKNVDLVIASGGDGTISTVVAALKDSSSTLGVLPCGTLNHFAKDLGIPLELDEAIDVMLEGRTIEVDVGEVNGRTFINNSSLGLYPHMVRRRDAQRRRFGSGKMWALFGASLALFRLFPMLHIKMSCNGEDWIRRTPFVFIGNNEYVMEGFRMADRLSLQGGQLSVYTSNTAGRRGLVWLALRALVGRLHETRGFESLLTDSLTIESRHPHVQVALDGEVTVLDTPLVYRIRPAALKVRVPAETGNSGSSEKDKSRNERTTRRAS